MKNKKVEVCFTETANLKMINANVEDAADFIMNEIKTNNDDCHNTIFNRFNIIVQRMKNIIILL